MKVAQVVLGLISGAALAVVLVLGVGILSVRAVATQAGAVLDIDNELVRITDPAVPVLEYVAIAVVGTTTLAAVVLGARRLALHQRIAVGAGFLTALLVLVPWGVRLDFRARPGQRADETGFGLEGTEGWLQHGASSPAVHLVLAVTLVAFLGRSRVAHGRLGSGPR